MLKWWKQLDTWPRVFLILAIPDASILVGQLIFHYSVWWFVLPNSVLIGVNAIVTRRTTDRKKRDGSYWGPRD